MLIRQVCRLRYVPTFDTPATYTGICHSFRYKNELLESFFLIFIKLPHGAFMEHTYHLLCS